MINGIATHIPDQDLTPRTTEEERKLSDALGGSLVESVPAEFARELEREVAGLRLACEDWIKIANSAANKLNAAVQERDAEKRWTESWARSANEADDRLKTWMATADAHLETIKRMRAALQRIHSLPVSERIFSTVLEIAGNALKSHD